MARTTASTRISTATGIRAALLCAAFAFGGLAQAQTTTQPASALGAAGQSTAPHTTNSQSAVSDQRSATGSSNAGTTGSAAGATNDVKNRSNIPHATPGQSTAASSGMTNSNPAGSGTTNAPIANSNVNDSIFDRADTNRDGQLSTAEAQQVPGLSTRFKELDKDRNGTLSRSEFAPYTRP